MNDSTTENVVPENVSSAPRRGRPRPTYTVERDALVAQVLASGERFSVQEIVDWIAGVEPKHVKAALDRLSHGDGTSKNRVNPRTFQPARGLWQATAFALTHDPRFGGDGTPREPREYPSTVLRLRTPDEVAALQASRVDEPADTPADEPMPGQDSLFHEAGSATETTATWQ